MKRKVETKRIKVSRWLPPHASIGRAPPEQEIASQTRTGECGEEPFHRWPIFSRVAASPQNGGWQTLAGCKRAKESEDRGCFFLS